MFFLSDEMPFSFDELLLFGAASGGKAIEDTATGNPLTFLTDLAKPLKSLLIPFTPQQEGSGDPSPENIRSILPWNGLTVFHSGADTSNPTETDIVFPSHVYGGTLDVVSGVLTVEYPTDEVSLDTLYFYMASDGNFVFMNLPFTFGDRAKIVCNSYKTVKFPYWNSMPDLSIMGSPSGDQIFRIRNDAFTDETTFRNHLTEIGAKIVYPLATPTEQTLTGHQLTALIGQNTMWSDADGSMTAIYFKKA